MPSEEQATNSTVVVIGGGPAGLTAAYELLKYGVHPIVLEKRSLVGGISCTENYKGYYFDMGGHRFFTKAKEVQELWAEVLGEEFLRRPRLSRIFYNDRFFYYPLKPLNAFTQLGAWQSTLAVLSYARWQVFPYRHVDTYQQWVTNRFGARLFQTFFKTYTEKVWGIPCTELKAEWAAQRIKDLDLKTAVVSMFFKPRRTIKTLIEEFDYPRRGPGMMWEAFQRRIDAEGGAVWMESDVVALQRTGKRIDAVVVERNGQRETLPGSHFISSMPVREMIEKLDPPAPPAVREAAERLHYRDFLTVCLIVNAEELFPDNWIYVHDPNVKVGRIQNFKNWSPDMVADPSRTSLGLEYFCTEGDDLWTMSDADLVELGRREIDHIGLAKAEDVEDGCVYRVAKTYPIYDSDYREHLAVVREYIDSLDNFQTIGRNGLHRYNNQDHAMLTGIHAVRNLILGEQTDLWAINADQEYHEEMEILQAAITRVFAKLDRRAFGLSLGTVSGVVLFMVTLALVLKGGDIIGPNLSLLREFFPGYTVSPMGAFLGLVYGFVAGFVVGWSVALLRNMTVFLTVALMHRGAEMSALRKVLEFI